MTGHADVRTGVRRFILDNFLIGEPSDALQDSTLLLTTGIISSLAMLELVAFLETEYEVALRPRDLTPDRLDSVTSILALIDELRQTAQPNT